MRAVMTRVAVVGIVCGGLGAALAAQADAR